MKLPTHFFKKKLTLNKAKIKSAGQSTIYLQAVTIDSLKSIAYGFLKHGYPGDLQSTRENANYNFAEK